MRYVLHPGPIVSKNDGQEHWITAPQLARLYGVDYMKCAVVYPFPDRSALAYSERPGDVHLHPSYSGDYRLPDSPADRSGGVRKRLTDLAKVRRRFPDAYAYQWGPREWSIYAAEHGPYAGIGLANGTSKKAAWLFAAMSPLVTSKRRRAGDTSSTRGDR